MATMKCPSCGATMQVGGTCKSCGYKDNGKGGGSKKPAPPAKKGGKKAPPFPPKKGGY